MVPKADGVREEGFLVELSSSEGDQEVVSVASKYNSGNQNHGWNFGEAICDIVHQGYYGLSSPLLQRLPMKFM